MTAPDARRPWRIGTSWGVHVYQGEKGSPGERPVATFHDPADAQRAVDAVNGSAALRAAVLALAEELDEASQIPIRGEFDRGIAAHQRDVAARLRAIADGQW